MTQRSRLDLTLLGYLNRSTVISASWLVARTWVTAWSRHYRRDISSYKGKDQCYAYSDKSKPNHSYNDPTPSFEGSYFSPLFTFSINSRTPFSPLTLYILLSSFSNSFISSGRTESRKLNSENGDKACSTDEENFAGWAVDRVTHVVLESLLVSIPHDKGQGVTYPFLAARVWATRPTAVCGSTTYESGRS